MVEIADRHSLKFNMWRRILFVKSNMMGGLDLHSGAVDAESCCHRLATPKENPGFGMCLKFDVTRVGGEFYQ